MRKNFTNAETFILALLVSGIITIWGFFIYSIFPLQSKENNTPIVSPQTDLLEPSIEVTKTSIPPSPSPTFSITPSSTLAPQTVVPSITPTLTPTATLCTPTPTLTPTEKTLIYIFPIRPISEASYQQGHHDYPATDIFAPEGTEYVAVTSGIVDFVRNTDEWTPEIDDPNDRGGLAIAIIGDDGIRYYGSHLSAVAEGISPGDRVQAGQLLGLVGNTGNARYVTPHLHFGISHPTYPEDWEVRRGEIDPYPYLEAWKDGIPLKPEL